MRYRILVVEDEPALQETLKGYLEPTYKVTAVSTAADAATVLEKVKYKVLLIDLGLPDSNGLDLIKQAIVTHKGTVVFALTGDKTEKSVREAIDAGVDNYLVKPVDPQKLRDRIEKAIVKSGFSS